MFGSAPNAQSLETNQIAQGGELLWANAANRSECFKALDRTRLNDDFGSLWTDSRQSFEFGAGCGINVDSSVGSFGTRDFADYGVNGLVDDLSETRFDCVANLHRRLLHPSTRMRP